MSAHTAACRPSARSAGGRTANPRKSLLRTNPALRCIPRRGSPQPARAGARASSRGADAVRAADSSRPDRRGCRSRSTTVTNISASTGLGRLTRPIIAPRCTRRRESTSSPEARAAKERERSAGRSARRDGPLHLSNMVVERARRGRASGCSLRNVLVRDRLGDRLSPAGGVPIVAACRSEDVSSRAR